MSNTENINELADKEELISQLLGEQVLLEPNLIYGTVEAVKMAAPKSVKISGDWYELKEGSHIILLNEI